MKYKNVRKKVFFVISMLIVCVMGQIQADAKSADTFIPQEYVAYCEEIGREYGICPELLEAIMESESSGNPQAGNGNCKGLMQVNTQYHKGRMAKLGVDDIYDAKGNIRLAADYLLELFQEYQDIGTVLMVYNGSKNALERGERADYTEYAAKIIRRSEQLERVHQK